MPRIAGVDLPEKKKIRFALRYIYGIGPKYGDAILAEAGVDMDKRAKDLTDQEVSQIATVIDASYIVEGALRRQTQQNIQRLRDIRCYRGERHRKGLPVRGQRTKCNARTRKGRKKTVAGKKGVKDLR
jgi:small subunit ribosomal protein S13